MDLLLSLRYSPGVPEPAKSSIQKDPILIRLKTRRQELGLSFRQLAERACLRSAAYVFHIENGHKTPSEDVARRLAAALGEDAGLLAAWARALRRSDLRTVLDASAVLLLDPELSAFAAGAWSAPEPSVAMTERPFARLRVPIIPEGADPGDGLRPECEIVRTVSLDAAALGTPQAFVRPFAYVLSEASAARVPGFGAGRIAIVSRAFEPLDPHRAHAVRTGAGVELGRVRWNGRELVLLSAPGEHEFTVLAASGAEGLRARVLGAVVRTLDASRIGGFRP